MNGVAFTAASYALIPVAAVVVGTVAAAFRPAGPYWRSATQHFAAGVVFAAAAAELLPDVMHGGSPVGVLIGFALGTGIMLVLKSITDRWESRGSSKATGLIATVGIDLFIDGVIIGIGFAAGAKQGVLLTAALSLEVLFLGLSTTSSLTRTGASKSQIIGIPATLSLLLVVGAGAGAGILGNLTATALEIVLSFGLAALLYLVTEELLIEAHEEPHSPLMTAMFFAGFLLLCMIEMMA